MPPRCPSLHTTPNAQATLSMFISLARWSFSHDVIVKNPFFIARYASLWKWIGFVTFKQWPVNGGELNFVQFVRNLNIELINVTKLFFTATFNPRVENRSFNPLYRYRKSDFQRRCYEKQLGYVNKLDIYFLIIFLILINHSLFLKFIHTRQTI